MVTPSLSTTHYAVPMRIPRVLLAAVALCLPLAAQEVARPKILGVAHVALRVSDIEASRAFYKDFCGYGEPFLLNKDDGSLSLTFIKVNDHQYVELFPGLDPAQDRLHHISFYTDDAGGMRKHLASRGVQVPDRTPKGRISKARVSLSASSAHLEAQYGTWFGDATRPAPEDPLRQGLALQAPDAALRLALPRRLQEARAG